MNINWGNATDEQINNAFAGLPRYERIGLLVSRGGDLVGATKRQARGVITTTIGGFTGHTTTASKGKARKRTARKMTSRNVGDVNAFRLKVREYIAANPGVGAEQIAKGLGMVGDPAVNRATLWLKKQKYLSATGTKRATRYTSTAKAWGAANGVTKTPAKRGRKPVANHAAVAN